MPLLQMPDGTLCLPVTAFFGYSTEIARVGISSLRDEGYILREWLAFMATRGRVWDRPSDDLMRSWRTSQLEVTEATTGDAAPTKRRRPSRCRIERKLEVVFTFYELLPRAFGFDANLNPFPIFVSDGAGQVVAGAGITAKVLKSKSGTAIRRWFGSEPVERGHIPRPTPSPGGVASILKELRTGRDKKPLRRRTKWAIDERQLIQERNWLIGRVAAKAGLRREEIAGLALDAFAKALDARMKIDWPTPLAGAHVLDMAATDPKLQEKIIYGLQGLTANHRKNLWVEVRGKGRGPGGKPRKVPFPIELVESLLDVGVWNIRRRQILHWSTCGLRHATPGNLFLSHKTKRGLGAGAIGDILKEAFRDSGELGSGHRLRAHFGMELALRLARERTAWNGERYDTGIRDWVIARVAEAMGHESSHTTVKYYVQLAEMEVLLSADGSFRGQIGVFLNKTKRSAPLVSPTDLELLSRLMDLLVNPDANPLRSEMLELLLEDFKTPA